MENLTLNRLNNTPPNKEYYTTRQLQLPLDWEILIEKDDPVKTFKEVMEGVNLGKYIKRESSKGRIGYNRFMMLELVLFGFMDKSNCSLRDLEKACKTDIRYMWLSNNEKPSYVSFCNFINNDLTDKIENIFIEINLYIKNRFNVDTTKAYIDGTKIEANANKYTFVWKTATLKFREKLYRKIDKEIKEINSLLNTNYHIKETYEINELLEILDNIDFHIKEQNIKIVEGKGHRKHPLQKKYEKMYKYYEDLWKYVDILTKCGDKRNSYSKTDVDATFMHLKEDYMRNGQLKPAYNLQHLVCDGFIFTITISSERDDFNTFIPTLNKFKELYGYYPKYPVADSGYGSYNNYKFLKDNDMELYTKYSMYSKDKEIGGSFLENFIELDDNTLLCPNNKKLFYQYTRKYKKLHYLPVKVYICEDCSNCPFKKYCMRSTKNKDKNKTLYYNKEWEILRKEAYDNLQTDFGNQLKINRSIQVEGSFGILKQDMEYRRLRRKGINNVKTEFYLNSIGFNLRKIFHLLYPNTILPS